MFLATSEKQKDKSGQEKEKTEWHRVVIFNDRLADVAKKYLKKRSKVYLEGQIQTRKWTGNDGVEKYTTEVVLNRFRASCNFSTENRESLGHNHAAPEPFDDLDDEMPFQSPLSSKTGAGGG